MPGCYAQGYFVYDSHKSGAQTVSHLRFGPQPIQAPYLIQQASFVGLPPVPVRRAPRRAAPGRAGRHVAAEQRRTGRTRCGTTCRARCSSGSSISSCGSSSIDASRRGGGGRAARPHQHRAADLLLRALRRAAARRGDRRRSSRRSARPTASAARTWCSAISPRWTRRWTTCSRCAVPAAPTSNWERPPAVPADAPAFVREVTAMMLEGRGDEIPVSALPVDGTWPSGTAVWEKRNIADTVPAWNQDLCIQCGQCSFVCPHGVIQAPLLRRGAAGRRAGQLQVGADQRARLPRRALHLAVLGRGLHRLRRCASRPARRQPGRRRPTRRSTCATSCR